jgi:hypothetical protein
VNGFLIAEASAVGTIEGFDPARGQFREIENALTE